MSPFNMGFNSPPAARAAARDTVMLRGGIRRSRCRPGSCSRPAWPDGESRRKWLDATHAIEVDRADLSDEMQARMGQFELMTAQ
jgi:hypothetical protein